MTAVLEGGEWSAARPGRTLTPGKDPVPILQTGGGGGDGGGVKVDTGNRGGLFGFNTGETY
jgi:hypothetical protein